MCNPSITAPYIDNQYVVDGISAVIDGEHTRLLKGPDGDLWARLVAAGPAVDPTWIPAHLAEEQAAGEYRLTW